jgi:uncharacterized membrane protein YbhN (UPF0104 family)
MKKMKKPPVAPEQRLRMRTLAAAVLAFLPCWFFGGMALWGAVCCVKYISPVDSWWFLGAFALSVIIGMASFLPGGIGMREAVIGAAVVIQLTPAVGHSQAVFYATVVAILQRLFQVVVELVLGVAGGALTSFSRMHSPGDASIPNDLALRQTEMPRA